MADKVTPREDGQQPTNNTTQPDQSEDRQGIFDKRFAAIMDIFGEACQQQGITTAIAIAVHPTDNEPMIFLIGHEFDVAALTGKVLRNLNHQLMSVLSGTGPRQENA